MKIIEIDNFYSKFNENLYSIKFDIITILYVLRVCLFLYLFTGIIINMK